jgi:predicted transcriptional regulator of viral defense system
MNIQYSPIATAQRLSRYELFAFNSRTFADLFELDKFQTSSLLQRMEQAGLIARVEQGKYIFLGLTPEKVLSNPLYIGSNLVVPSYISYWSALHYHGLTEQSPRKVFVAISRRKAELSFGKLQFKFVTIKSNLFFGYKREVHSELPIVVADEAKSILDSLYLPHYAGGITEVAKALQIAFEEKLLDIPTLVDYANRFESPSLSSRLGYLLELLGQDAHGLQISKGPVRLDPHNSELGTFNARWKLFVNIQRSDLFPEGVA